MTAQSGCENCQLRLGNAPGRRDPRREVRPYQAEIHRALDEQLRGGHVCGIVNLPTGAGKTFTIVHWIVERLLQRPGRARVLWLAHNSALLRQAEQCFEQEGVPSPHLAVVAGRGALVRAANERRPVSLFSIYTLGREGGLELLRSWIGRDPLFVVVDEAHHAEMATYRELLGKLTETPALIGLVGLTATPHRSDGWEENRLLKRFGRKLFARVTPAELIAGGYLAQPQHERIHTDVVVPVDAATRDAFALERLARAIDAGLAVRAARNAVIRKHLVGRRRAGKVTRAIVFVPSIDSANHLASELAAEGFGVLAYVSGGDDLDPCVFECQHRGIDVVVSVSKLSEGVDLPKANVVYLGAPTFSKVRFVQMVGRVMRGPASSGTDDAVIVDIVDNWGRFSDWLVGWRHVEDGFKGGDPPDRPPTRLPPPSATASSVPDDVEEPTLPVEVLQAIWLALRDGTVAVWSAAVQTSTIARLAGYYRVQLELAEPDPDTRGTRADEAAVDIDFIDHTVLVFDSQLAAYQRFAEAVRDQCQPIGGRASEAQRTVDNAAAEAHFADIHPRPAGRDLAAVAEWVSKEGKLPQLKALDTTDRSNLEVWLATVTERLVCALAGTYGRAEKERIVREALRKSSALRAGFANEGSLGRFLDYQLKRRLVDRWARTAPASISNRGPYGASG